MAGQIESNAVPDVRRKGKILIQEAKKSDRPVSGGTTQSGRLKTRQ
jgi:hypothetical protein